MGSPTTGTCSVIGARIGASVDDGVGAQTHMLRLGWEPPFGGLLELHGRTIDNEDYSGVAYERGYDVGLGYSRGLKGFTVGADVLAGRDVFGESYGRLAGFVRFGDEWAGGGAAAASFKSERPLQARSSSSKPARRRVAWRSAWAMAARR